ncbi:MAG: hypothetical protein HC882_05850, partial [Acidobacteria bacterium]|nr:hypothetical protein [Acidobacteriota bacterium]
MGFTLRRLPHVALALVLALGVGSAAWATDYYVRTDGSDSCNGRSNTGGTGGNCAFRTISKADSVAVCGDTIRIGAGLFSEAKLRINDACSATTKKTIVGAGRGSTFWMGGLVDLNESACVADSNPGVYRCPAPSGFAAGAAGDPELCFVQRNTNAVRFLDENGTKGDMTGPVCVTWNTSGPASVSATEGHVYYDGSGNFYIKPWNGLSPAQADFWVPSSTSYSSGADGPVYLEGNHITVRDLTVIGANYCNVAGIGDDITIEGVDVYTGMTWFESASARATIRNVKMM